MDDACHCAQHGTWDRERREGKEVSLNELPTRTEDKTKVFPMVRVPFPPFLLAPPDLTSSVSVQPCPSSVSKHALYALPQCAILALPPRHLPSRPRPTFLSTWVAPPRRCHRSHRILRPRWFPSSVLLHLQAKTKPRKICARLREFPQCQAQIRRALQPQYLMLHL